jgi:hypothetical protein
MCRLYFVLAAVCAALAISWLATPATGEAGSSVTVENVAQANAPAQSGDEERDVAPMVIWSLVGIGVAVAVGGTFYLLKRRIGGFPANPSWVAPISIEPSSTFPEDYGNGPANLDGPHH